jgi:polyisoprenoid-binding protein YceI
VDLSKPEGGISGKVSIRTNSLNTGVEGRDEAMLEHLASELNPNIEFVFESFKSSASDRAAKTLAGQVMGKMTINGTTQAITMKVTAYVDESRRLVIEGEAPLSRADYNVEIPGQLGVITVEDEVRIWIHLRSRAKTEGGK